MSAFKITFLLRSGRDVECFIQEDCEFKSDDELHAYVISVIEDREEGMFKAFGEVTLLFSQIDGWKIEEFASDHSAKLSLH